MNDADISLYSTVAVILVLAVFLLFTARKQGSSPVSPLLGISIGLFLGGLLYRDTRFVGGGLFAAAVLLAIADQFIRLKRKSSPPARRSGEKAKKGGKK